METGEFMAILDRIMEEEPAGVKEDARWPHSGPIYIELTEASPGMPEEYRGFVHSFIITEDYGDDIRIPNNLENGPGTIGAGLNIKTGEIVGIFGPETRWERTIELVRTRRLPHRREQRIRGNAKPEPKKEAATKRTT